MGRKVQAADDVADEMQDVSVDEVQDGAVAADPVEADPVEADPVGAEYGDAGPGPFRVLAEFTAMVGAQLCTFKAGAVIDPLAGAELAAGGAPVEPV